MTNKEILAQLKKSYENLQDIRENGCNDHCKGQLEKENIERLENAMSEIAETYSNLRNTLCDDECEVIIDNKTYYIGQYVDEDYSSLYNEEDNYTYWLTCRDLDYYWYEDEDFLRR